jgi:O-antigen/teichoic acid export membrane protein
MSVLLIAIVFKYNEKLLYRFGGLKMNHLNMLIKNFTSSAFGNIIGQILAFFTLLYLPNVLGPSAYGIYNSAVALMMYFFLLCDLGLSIYCIREVNKKNNGDAIINKIFMLKFYLSILSSILFVIICILVYRDTLERITFVSMSVGVFSMGVYIDYAFNAKNDMKYIGRGNIIKNLLFFIFVIIFIKTKNDIYYATILYSLSLMITSLYLILAYNKRYHKLKFTKIEINDIKLIKYALPMAISLLMVQINNNFDILYLSFVKGKEIVGYYSAAYRIINAIITIMVFYFNSAYPTISELHNKNKEMLKNYMEKFYVIGAAFIFPITFGGIALGNKIILLLYSQNYFPSIRAFKILLVLLIIRYISSVFGAVLIMGNESKKFTMCVIIGAIINVILNIVLVPKYSFIGSSFSTIVCEMVQMLLLFYFCFKDIKFKFIKNTIILLFCSSIMFISLEVIKTNLYLSIVIGIIIYILLFGIIYFRDISRLMKKNNI